MSNAQKDDPKEAQKDVSQDRQKQMLADHFGQLARAKENNRKVAYTFVPGNLTELLGIFDMLPVYPEINALQSAMRQKSAGYIREAERQGHNEDVCTYVKCDIGMMSQGNKGPTGEQLPAPDLLLLSYTGCFTFLKWFELLQKEYNCELAMLHVPYVAGERPTEEMRQYVAKQLREEIIPRLERISGKKYDEAALKERLKRSAQAEDDLVWVLESAKHRPSPIDGYFGAVYYVGPIFTAFRGTEPCRDYYRALRAEVQGRLDRHEGPVTPDGTLTKEKFRLVVEGPPNWTHFRDFWRIFHDEGAVFVASTYAKVGGLYDEGFRHDQTDDPLLALADYCMGCYTNLSLPRRVGLLEKYVKDFQADGFVFNSVKSCNSFSAGQLVMLRELEKRTGVPGAFIETDLVDPRYYGHANIKNRIESYLQMLAQRMGSTASLGTGS
ncbi:MAG: type benzoyl-CoA reductase BcrB subunit [Myxococcaceae bacterium]|nr:type benzoyl-CoA reductase BcrB subunit [Myxococcaceae bacterium]